MIFQASLLFLLSALMSVVSSGKITVNDVTMGNTKAEVGVRGSVGYLDGFDERNDDEREVFGGYEKREAVAIRGYKQDFVRSYGLVALIRVPREHAYNDK